jgi:UPF0271 protein
MHAIDLNADIGEAMGDDAALLPLVSSANIACGFHAGDAETMRSSIELCRRHRVVPGAHPSYPDRAGFGRRAMSLEPAGIHAAVVDQVQALAGIARAAGVRLAHVKPHGALYNHAAVDRVAADAIARAVADCDPALALVGLAGSQLLAAGRELGLRVLAEGFADRRYTAAGTLVPRAEPDALIDTADEAEAQVLAMVREGAVRARDGARIAVAIDTVCLHGDGAHALEFANRLRATLAAAGIAVRAPTA